MTKTVGGEEKPVTQVELDHGINSGIHLKGVAGGLVPIQEEHEARLEYGFSLAEWGQMDTVEKSLIVAVRRNKMAMQNITTDTEIGVSERDIRRGSKRT